MLRTLSPFYHSILTISCSPVSFTLLDQASQLHLAVLLGFFRQTAFLKSLLLADLGRPSPAAPSFQIAGGGLRIGDESRRE